MLVKLDEQLKKDFIFKACVVERKNASEVIRELILEYLSKE